MRNGFLCAIGTALLWVSLAHGQPDKVRANLLAPTEDVDEAAKPSQPASPPPKKLTKLPAADSNTDGPVVGSKAASSSTGSILSTFTEPPCPGCAPTGAPYPAFWGSVDYLLWFVKSGPVNGPLLTTGSPADPVPGAVGQPHTQVLVGDSLNYNPLSGGRFFLGAGLTDNIGIEGGYFFLQQGNVGYTAVSNPTGSPLIARPYFDTFLHIQNAALSSLPGTFAGGSNINSQSRLQGYELNLAGRVVRDPRLTLDLLAGFRALDLNEALTMTDAIVPPGSANLNFGNINVPVGGTLLDFDRFQTSNQFYGGQLGTRVQWYYGRFTVGATAKVALGATQQLAIIDGASAVLTPGAAPLVMPGGVLAQTSNIGRYYRDEFTVVPEGQLNLGWQVRPWMTLNVGYTFLYSSDVLRPGLQIDRNVNASLIPTGQSFGLGNNSGPPFFAFHGSDFWAQGINFGVLFRY